MQLDDLKEAWAAHGATLERSLRVNEQLLREVMTRRIRSTLKPYVLWRALEVAVGLVAVILVGSVLADHTGETGTLLIVGVVHVFAIAMTGLSAYLLVTAARLDYDGSIARIQRDVQRMRLVEYHAFKWALLGGILLWLPAALVLFEAVTGADVLAAANPLWVTGNLVLGVVVLAIGHVLSKRHVERPDLKPWARRLVDQVSGRQLRSVTKSLAELSSFEREES